MQVWFELHTPASADDMELLEVVLSSWFMLGRLGGFNAMNLQVCRSFIGSQDLDNSCTWRSPPQTCKHHYLWEV